MIGFQKIREMLPQDFPILMVDRVLRFEEGKSLSAIKNVSGNDIFFLGHFPRMAIMPGVLLLEALGQCTILLFQITYGSMEPDDLPLFGDVKAKFHQPVFPGDQLSLQVEAVKMTASGGIFQGQAHVGERKIVTAELGMGRRRSSQVSRSKRREHG